MGAPVGVRIGGMQASAITPDVKKQILGAYLPLDRGKILTAFINPMRLFLQHAAEQRKEAKPLEVAFCKRLAQKVQIIDAILGHCNGTETYDKVAFGSMLADLRGLANDPEVLKQCLKMGTAAEEKEFADEADVIAFVRGFEMPPPVEYGTDLEDFLRHHAATTD